MLGLTSLISFVLDLLSKVLKPSYLLVIYRALEDQEVNQMPQETPENITCVPHMRYSGKEGQSGEIHKEKSTQRR